MYFSDILYVNLDNKEAEMWFRRIGKIILKTLYAFIVLIFAILVGTALSEIFFQPVELEGGADVYDIS